MSEIRDIPEHWEVKKLGEVCEIIMGQSPSSSTYNLSGIGMPFFQGKAEFTELYPIVEKWCDAPKKVALPNDILLSVRAPVGTTNIANQKCCIGRGLAAIRYENYKYVFYFLRSIEQQLDKKGTGTTFRAISGEIIRTTDIPLPPLPEQQAIVAKIEELLSELDNGKQQLQTALQQLKVYRQSLLKWAFEGKELLPFESFVDASQNGLSKRTGTNGEEYKVLRLADITNNVIDKSSPRKIVMDENEIEKYKIKQDDLICIRVNGSKDLVGKLVHVSNQNEKDNWAFCDHFIRFRLHPQKAYSKYFHFYFSTVKMRKYIHENMVTSAGQNTVSQATIKNAPVPNCSIEQQQLIVDELESKLTVCDKVEEAIKLSLQQAETLRQSILKQAFEGKLV